MAGFKMHITVSTLCGVGYGVATVKALGHPIETAFLAGGLTAFGGMLPDLDSDSGTPVREVSGLAAAVIPLLLYNRIAYTGLHHEAILAILLASYLAIRYFLVWAFKRFTIHRGMFHSIPAMCIAGLLVYLAYDCPVAEQATRYVLAVGLMLGFLSHLILDEIYSVEVGLLKVKVKSSSGTALKFSSASPLATGLCYGMLGALIFLAYADYKNRTGTDPVADRLNTWRGNR